LKNRFGSRDYAAEELIAELGGAAFLSAEFGFDGDVRNAGYIASWIELLTADKRAFFYRLQQSFQGGGVSARLGACRARINRSVIETTLDLLRCWCGYRRQRWYPQLCFGYLVGENK
jgi:hypothetical protein